MATTQKLEITRRGFDNSPLDIRYQAERHVADFAAAGYSSQCYASLRRAYDGPGRLAAPGSWSLIILGGTAYHHVFLFPSQDEER